MRRVEDTGFWRAGLVWAFENLVHLKKQVNCVAVFKGEGGWELSREEGKEAGHPLSVRVHQAR